MLPPLFPRHLFQFSCNGQLPSHSFRLSDRRSVWRGALDPACTLGVTAAPLPAAQLPSNKGVTESSGPAPQQVRTAPAQVQDAGECGRRASTLARTRASGRRARSVGRKRVQPRCSGHAAPFMVNAACFCLCLRRPSRVSGSGSNLLLSGQPLLTSPLLCSSSHGSAHPVGAPVPYGLQITSPLNCRFSFMLIMNPTKYIPESRRFMMVRSSHIRQKTVFSIERGRNQL